MTQDEVIDMARFAGITIDNFGFQGGFIEEFVVFSKLVAAKEREACAKICDEFCYGSTKILIERAIRARGTE
jgi:hypothetical protein